MPNPLLVASNDEHVVPSMERCRKCAVPKHASVIEAHADSMSDHHFHRSNFVVKATAGRIG